MTRLLPPLLLALGCLVLTGCLASTVVERDARAVEPVAPELDWRPLELRELPGLYASESVDGPAAAVLREVHYWFGPEGRFTGAALFLQPEPSFQVLDGSWRLEDGLLTLGELAAPARAEVAGERLRLSGDEGTVVLRRVGDA